MYPRMTTVAGSRTCSSGPRDDPKSLRKRRGAALEPLDLARFSERRNGCKPVPPKSSTSKRLFRDVAIASSKTHDSQHLLVQIAPTRW